MKRINILLFLSFFTITLLAQEIRPVKNIIVMIPDGTSIGVYSAARWFKQYNNLVKDCMWTRISAVP